jgi:hypothetical protein
MKWRGNLQFERGTLQVGNVYSKIAKAAFFRLFFLQRSNHFGDNLPQRKAAA